MNDEPSRLTSLLPLLTAGELQWDFRTVSYEGSRRGLRLERIFWDALKKMAAEKGVTLGRLVEEIAVRQEKPANLASAIRAICLNWLARGNEELRLLASMRTTVAIITACPSPAFALSAARRISAFNQPFQMLVRRHLPPASGMDVQQEMKLTLDLNVREMLEHLRENMDTPLVTGFVLGLGERRYRGQLRAVLAPTKDTDLLIAFVTG